MASLYKKPVFLTDPKTGLKVKTKSKKWWGRYRDENGVEKRVPLATDKTAAMAMLNDLVVKVERRIAGTIDPFDECAKCSLSRHIDDFEEHQRSKNNSKQHVCEITMKIRRIVKTCKWSFMRDISASEVQRCLAEWRESRLSIQTSNHYLRAIKQFTRWLVRDRRAPHDPLIHLAMLNVKVDRRHDRRPLTADEFQRLIEAAIAGPHVVCISGPDRAMMYILAGWTGYRRAELGSLTRRSLRLDADPPTVTVAAAYSKRKRQDTQVLHPEVARRLEAWLKTKGQVKPDELLFPVSDRVPGGIDRRTSKMMRADLASARSQWIEEATKADEKRRREESDFLRYQDDNGLFADFHSNRHTFITNLERAGVSPRTAQSLARHSDIRLTMEIYTHIGLHDQSRAIQSLPAPPPFKEQVVQSAAHQATGTEGSRSWVPKPRRARRKGAHRGAERCRNGCRTPRAAEVSVGIRLHSNGRSGNHGCGADERPNSATGGTLCTELHQGRRLHRQSNAEDSSTPDRIRTCNPRFRRPMRYPIAPRARRYLRIRGGPAFFNGRRRAA